MPRIALGGIWQETNTYAPEPTTAADFRRYEHASGAALVDRFAGTGTELGGAIAAGRAAGADLVGLTFAGALPAGLLGDEDFTAMTADIVRRAAEAGDLDGIVLVCHGALAVGEREDPEADLVTALRAVVGDIPIAVTLDYHGNVGPRLAAAADLLVAYRTYPHVDMADVGREAMELVLRLAGDAAPAYARRLVKLPLLTIPPMQDTADEPMRTIEAHLADVRARPGVLTASVLPGFPYADVPRLGFSVYVAAERGADALADELASDVWARRAAFEATLVEPDDAVAAAGEGDGPVVIADVADNLGGGSPGDGTVLLAALERRAGRDGVVMLWDPVAVASLHAAEAAHADLDVGGRSTTDLGAPVRITGPVRLLGEVRYTRSGTFMRGQPVSMGRVAVVDSAAGAVVLTEQRVAPFDDDHLPACGIDPAARQIIVAKGAIAWKTAYGHLAARTIYARTPGCCPADLHQLEYGARPHPLHPLDDDVEWSPTTTEEVPPGCPPPPSIPA